MQSIPSPKAEPFKLWLAKVGYERIEEIEDPELAIDRAMQMYLKKGYSKDWINQRIKTIEVRKELTDEWEERGLKEGLEFAILMDEITKAWSGKSIKQYKKFKNLQKQNLRDNMTEAELIFTALAELSTTRIAKTDKAKGYNENAKAGHRGGRIAGDARKALEQQTGEKVVSPQNFLPSQKNIKKLLCHIHSNHLFYVPA